MIRILIILLIVVKSAGASAFTGQQQQVLDSLYRLAESNASSIKVLDRKFKEDKEKYKGVFNRVRNASSIGTSVGYGSSLSVTEDSTSSQNTSEKITYRLGYRLNLLELFGSRSHQDEIRAKKIETIGSLRAKVMRLYGNIIGGLKDIEFNTAAKKILEVEIVSVEALEEKGDARKLDVLKVLELINEKDKELYQEQIGIDSSMMQLAGVCGLDYEKLDSILGR